MFAEGGVSSCEGWGEAWQDDGDLVYEVGRGVEQPEGMACDPTREGSREVCEGGGTAGGTVGYRLMEGIKPIRSGIEIRRERDREGWIRGQRKVSQVVMDAGRSILPGRSKALKG